MSKLFRIQHWVAGLLCLGLCGLGQPAAVAGPIRTIAAFNDNVLPRNDDGSTGLVPLGFPVNFFGKTYSSAYVNNNGNITFDKALATFTPFGLSRTQAVIIAPFFADVDTRGEASNVTRYGRATIGGRKAFGVNWINVGYYGSHTDKLNKFQLVLIARPDCGPADFDIEFNYSQVDWETGDASGGNAGLGGSPVRVGYANGTDEIGSFYELPGSGQSGAFLDSNKLTGLIYNNLNSDRLGRYRFSVRGGRVGADSNPPTVNISTPTDGAVLSDLSSITGTASDDKCGSGIEKVEIAIQRQRDLKYWNGFNWSTGRTLLRTRFLGANWSAPFGGERLPSGYHLWNGQYTITAVVRDLSTNTSSTSVNFRVKTSSNLAFTRPVDGDVIQKLPVVEGTATDSNGGSNISRVDLSLQRLGDEKWWDGGQWVIVPDIGSIPVFHANYDATTRTWSRSNGLPSGSALADGDYLATATAVGDNGNSSINTIIFTVDNIGPRVTFLSPHAGGFANSLMEIRGTVEDKFSTSGIRKVDLYIKRNSDNLYWSGTAWGAGAKALETEVVGTLWVRKHSAATPMPNDTGLIPGDYELTAFGYDNGGNRRMARITVTIESTPPSVAITSPANGAVVRNLNEVRGTAADANGIERVNLFISRQRGDGTDEYWTGKDWSTARIALSTSVSGGSTWVRSTNMPGGADLRSGTYTLTATAFDRAGNARNAVASVKVDSAAPVLNFTSPGDNSTVSNLNEVRGTAVDPAGGTGFAAVTLFIQRRSDGLYWTGSHWDPRPTPLSTTVGSTSWFRVQSTATPMPAGASLASGDYYLTATAVDRAGNSGSKTITVTVDNGNIF